MTDNSEILAQWIQSVKNTSEFKGDIHTEELLRHTKIRWQKADFGYDMVTLDSRSSGGVSRKIRNISLNIGAMFTSLISGGVGILSGLTPAPYGEWYNVTATSTAVLILIREIVRAYSVSVSDREGLVLWVLHAMEYHQEVSLKGDCSEENILRCVNIITEKDELPEMKAGELREILNKLESLDCVSHEDNQWIPLEIVTVKPKD